MFSVAICQIYQETDATLSENYVFVVIMVSSTVCPSPAQTCQHSESYPLVAYDIVS